MAQLQRQSTLFAAEDFRTIYRTFSEINFTAYDFDTIKASMIEYLQRNFPEDFNDFIESSEFIAIVELLSYMGQTIAFRQDLNTRENFLDTAERKESVLRLAKMLNYTPKRNTPGTGIIKLHSVRTTEDVYDSNNKNLASQSIAWNDANNNDFLEQFILVLNKAFGNQNPFGSPVSTATIGGIDASIYQINAEYQTNVVFGFNASVNGTTKPFEVVNCEFNPNGYIQEVDPDPSNAFGILYLDDQQGLSSSTSGFFGYIKQGSLQYQDFNLEIPLPNREIYINVENINNIDVWAQTLDTNGNVIATWEQVPAVSGNNIAYNSILRGTRNIFTVTTEADNTVSLKFADGQFGDIPSGIMRVWYRVSANELLTVKPSDVGLQTVQIPYVNVGGVSHTLHMVLELKTTIGNNLPSESVDEIKTNAPQVFYTQDRMVSGEDYNVYPVFKNANIVKIKSINRTHAGHSRYIDVNDPTGTVQNLNVFADDGIVYKDIQNTEITFNLVASATAASMIQQYIQPGLNSDELTNFYYDTYQKAVQAVDSSSAWEFLTNEQLDWVPLPDAKESNLGYFILKGTSAFTVNAISIGSIASGKTAYLVEKCLLEFTDPETGSVEYATIENIVNNGDPTGLTSGPVQLNKPIKSGHCVINFYPAFRRLFSNVESSEIYTQLELRNSFGIGYDYKTASFYVIAANNLDLTSPDINLANAKDITSSNQDASWVIKAVFNSATSVTSASYTITTRGLRYIFESENDVRFYFNNAFKTIDIQTGKAKKDEIHLLKVNVDKRAQISGVTVTNPGNGYTVAPAVTFQQSGDVDTGTADVSLSWNMIAGGIGGSGYKATDSSKAYLDSTVVDANGKQTEISINNNGVLSADGRSVTIRANLSNTAEAIIVLATDALGQFTITNPGTNYTSAPTVVIDPPTSGITATADAIVSQGLTGFAFSAPSYQGGGYQNIPSLYIDQPGFTGTTWTITHNLNQQRVNFELMDLNYDVINTIYNAPVVTAIDVNTLQVAWPTSQTGYVNVIKSREGFGTVQPASNIWTIVHSLTGTEGIVNVDLLDDANVSMQGTAGFPLIEYTSETQCRIIFPGQIGASGWEYPARTGYALMHNSFGNSGTVGSGYLHTQSAQATTWTITHNLGRKLLNVDIAVLGSNIINATTTLDGGLDVQDFNTVINPALYYNIRGLYDYPVIHFIDENTLSVTFSTAIAGKAIITSGELFGSQAQAAGVIHMEIGDDSTAPSGCSAVIINNAGTGFIAADVGEIYTINAGSTTASHATVTIDKVWAVGAHKAVDTFSAADALRTAGTYTGVTGTSAGSGTVGTFNIIVDGTGDVTSVIVVSGGSGHAIDDTITIADADLGAGGATNFTMDVALVSATGEVAELSLTTGGDYTEATGLDGPIASATVTPATATGVGLTLDLNYRVKNVALTTAGDGYQTLPTVIIDAPTGTCATGSNAVVTASAAGTVTSLVITNPGSGYTSAPSVAVSGGGGVNAAATAILSSSVSSATITDSGTGYVETGKVVNIQITNAGSGYITAPAITLVGGGGASAAATATIAAGVISAITITNNGTGYTTAPTVVFTGGGGTLAAASATISSLEITFPSPSNPPVGVVPITATGTATVNAAGNLATITMTQGGAGYDTTTDAGASLTIPPSGQVESVEIIDSGYGYTAQPIITYPTTTMGTGAVPVTLTGFISNVNITDPGSNYSEDTVVSFTVPTSSISGKSTATGLVQVRADKNFAEDIVFNMSSLLTYEDGYQDPKKAIITFQDVDNDMVPDNPTSFGQFVNLSRYIFQESYTDYDGYEYYKLSRNVLQADNQTEENLIIADGVTWAGKYIYRVDLTEFRKIGSTSPYNVTTLENDVDGAKKFKAYIGRSSYNTPVVDTVKSLVTAQKDDNVFFQWKHYAPIDHRIDPSVTNLIDIFLLTNAYYVDVLYWKNNNKAISDFPVPPTTTELALSMTDLTAYKSISDEIIFKPAKFKLLFGDSAEAELRATFKVIKVVGSTMSDNELRSRIVAVTEDFFNIANWDFGESFYYTELAAYIHQNIPGQLSSIVIVPSQTESNFGNLFQVKAEPNELFLSTVTVNNVEVVKGFTEQNLKIR